MKRRFESCLRFLSIARPAAVSVAACLAMSGAALADYKLAPGDVLEISAAGLPELRQKAQIGPDGEVTLPLIGPMQVAGLELSAVRAKAQSVLPSREFRRRTDDGREYPVIVSPNEINIAIAEYRPVYLNGDVSKPGEQPYRPGMTVRQAVALAGGYDVARFRMNNPYMEQADLRGEYESLWAQFAKEQAHIARLNAELNNKADLDSSSLAKTPIPQSLAASITGLETERLKTRISDFGKEKAYLSQAAKQEDNRLAVLTEQQRKEHEGTQVDAEDLRRLQELYQKGTLPITRIVDARRSLLLSATRELQTTVQLAQVERERGEIGRKLQRTDDQRRLELLQELQDANVKLAGLRSRLEATGEKLVYTGLVRSQLVRGKGSRPDLVVYRQNGAERKRLVVDEDTQVLPGDVVEVALQADLNPAGAPVD